MFSPQEYIIGWSLYLLAVLGLLVVFWHITRPIVWVHLKGSLRLLVATLLLLPSSVENAATYWAPAWIKAFLQLVFGGFDEFLPIGKQLLIAILIVLMIYLLLLIALHLYRKRYSNLSKEEHPE